jgi:hypothetical protein
MTRARLTLAERETSIVVSREDIDRGFFRIETTERPVLSRLRRLVGDRLVVHENRSRLTGQPSSWIVTVPAEYWQGDQLRVGRKASRPDKREAIQNARQARKPLSSDSVSGPNPPRPISRYGSGKERPEILVPDKQDGAA